MLDDRSGTTSGYGAMDVVRRPDRDAHDAAPRRPAACATRNFHTTALCSPTRSSLLNGRNAHQQRHARASPRAPPASRASPRASRSRTASSPRCWASAAGTRTRSASGTSRRRRSRTCRPGSGAGRSGAASSASTASSAARRTSGIRTSCTTTTRSTSPTSPRRATTSRRDLADKALEFMRDAKSVAPDKPWYMYFCPGCAPRAAPRASRSGRTATRAASTRATRRSGSRSSPARRSWGCCRRTPSCRRSTRTASPT